MHYLFCPQSFIHDTVYEWNLRATYFTQDFKLVHPTAQSHTKSSWGSEFRVSLLGTPENALIRKAMVGWYRTTLTPDLLSCTPASPEIFIYVLLVKGIFSNLEAILGRGSFISQWTEPKGILYHQLNRQTLWQISFTIILIRFYLMEMKIYKKNKFLCLRNVTESALFHSWWWRP